MILSEHKERFYQIFQSNVKRDGAAALLEWMDHRTDFFTCPASTKFHLCCEEGLLIHSLNVYDMLKERNDRYHVADEESIALVALLHDLCKANFYKVSTRNVKDPDTGRWEQVPYYSIDDQFPYGHGEKSVYLVERFVRLKPAEAMAIRWHMGGFDDNARVGGFNVANAFNRYPLAVHLHLADLEATYILERPESE